MAKSVNKVKEIDVATVEGGNALAAGLDRRAVARCKDAIEKLGVVHTPVIGATRDGRRMLLSGQCGLAALRELGVKKVEAIEIGIAGEAGTRAKLSLLLMSLKDEPGALCEGLLIQEAVGAGVPRAEIQAMLGKSASWVSNRISLVTRLDGNVYELVRSGLLDPRSAQEIARLPAGAQFPFAEAAVRECLPKSAVESLVACYNDEGCPAAVKTQILHDPRSALRRTADRRRAVNAGQPDFGEGDEPQRAINECIRMARAQTAMLCRLFFNGPTPKPACHIAAMKELEMELLALVAAVRGSISPGKMEAGHNAG